MPTLKLIKELHVRELLGANKTMNDENATALCWCLEQFPDQGVPNDLLTGVEELMKLPHTKDIDRSIAWIAISALKAYEEVAIYQGRQLFDEERHFSPREVNPSTLGVELNQLGFGETVETIDALAIQSMHQMLGYFSDASEWLPGDLWGSVNAFVAGMMPFARMLSKEQGLQEKMLKRRVDEARASLLVWNKKLEAFDRGEPVHYELGDHLGRQVESREKLLDVIQSVQSVLDSNGRWWSDDEPGMKQLTK